MSTFLAICKNTSRECRIAGGDSVPTAVTGQTGVLDQIVNHVIQSWTKIQEKYQDWRWMRAGFTLSATSGDGVYAYTDCTDIITSAAIARFSHWLLNDPEDQPKIYLTSDGVGTEGWLRWVEWNDFKRIYRVGTQSNAYPAHISVNPENNLVLGPVPNGTYTVSGDFQRGPQILAADADEPDMPARYHDLIMWEAVKRHSMLNNKPELLAQARSAAAPMMQALELNQRQPIKTAGPMV